MSILEEKNLKDFNYSCFFIWFASTQFVLYCLTGREFVTPLLCSFQIKFTQPPPSVRTASDTQRGGHASRKLSAPGRPLGRTSETLVRPRKRKEEDSRRFDSATSHQPPTQYNHGKRPTPTHPPSHRQKAGRNAEKHNLSPRCQRSLLLSKPARSD